MTPPGQPQSVKLRLLESHEIGPAIRHFTFEVPAHEQFGFVPGQFLSLSAEINGKTITRAYSIASIPSGNIVELCLNLVPSGLFSPFLFSLPRGGEVEAKGPYGGFVLKKTPGPTICVATGTGIAPFRGMLSERLAADPENPYVLVFGARHHSGLVYQNEWEQLASFRPNFQFVPTLTRPPEPWTGRMGRVQAHVLEAIGDRTDWTVYICGLKEMVDDLRGQLRSRGLDRKQIVYEKYD